MHMHLETSAILALAVIGHAWIMRVEGPALWRNVAAWVFALFVTIVLLVARLVVR